MLCSWTWCTQCVIELLYICIVDSCSCALTCARLNRAPLAGSRGRVMTDLIRACWCSSFWSKSKAACPFFVLVQMLVQHGHGSTGFFVPRDFCYVPGCTTQTMVPWSARRTVGHADSPPRQLTDSAQLFPNQLLLEEHRHSVSRHKQTTASFRTLLIT